MDFESACKAVTAHIAHSEREVCHQIEYISVQGQRKALEKVLLEEDIEKLHSSSSEYPNLDGEFQVRQMFEKAMGKRKSMELPYERKLFDFLIKESFENTRHKDTKKNLVNSFLVKQSSGDFYNENFLKK
jgi:hypothetical protein